MTGADDNEGLRERKKRLTRQLIAATAMRLFTEHGFDAVTVTQIAEAAGVAEKTVYNYFPRKTDLFFDEAGDILAELLFTVKNRKPGRSALDAVQAFVSGRAEWAADRRPARPSRRFRNLIADSPALQAGMRDMFARYETALSGLLTAETGAPLARPSRSSPRSRWSPWSGPRSKLAPPASSLPGALQPAPCACFETGSGATPSPERRVRLPQRARTPARSPLRPPSSSQPESPLFLATYRARMSSMAT